MAIYEPDWKRLPLKDVVEGLTGGGTPDRENPDYWNGRIPWASVKDLRSARAPAPLETISEEGLRMSASRLIAAGTIVLGVRMAPGRAVRFSVDVAINQDLKAVFPKQSIETDFLHQWFRFHEPTLESLATGSTVKGLRLETILTLPILVPPLTEQRKIAAILSGVDEAIEATQAVIDQLQVVKKAMMAELLTKGLPGRHTKFKQTEIGEIPINWNVARLDEIATVERGRFSHRPRNDPEFYGGPYPFVQTGDVAGANGILSTYSQTLNERGRAVSKMFPAGTILITIAANIGDTAIAQFPVYFPDSLVGIVPDCTSANPAFLEAVLRTRKAGLEASAPQNAQKNINLEILKPLLIQMPPRDEQDTIADAMAAILARQSAEEDGLHVLRTLKSALMSVLLTGEVRVKVDPTEVAA